jgi:D-inositol-3-phosphate glycosyltransferase
MLSVHTCPLAVLGGKEAGGMNVYVRELSRELGRRGIQVDVFTRAQNSITPFTHTLSENARIIHLPAGPLKPYNKNDVFYHLPEFVQNITNFQRCEKKPYNLIHAHYWLSGWAGLTLRKKWGTPVVQMFHTMAHFKNATARNEAERESDLRTTRENELMQRVDRIITATPMEKAQLNWECNVPADKIETIPCGVDLKLFRPWPRAEAKARLGLTARRNVLLVGRIDPIKGVDVLIEAARRLIAARNWGAEDFQVLVVGGGNRSGQDENPEAQRLHALVQGLGLSEQIRFLPSAPQQQMPLFYSAADITVMSSHYESFGMAALESQACGTPVIASRVGGLPSAVQDGCSGLLFEDNDTEGLSDKLGLLFDNPAYRRTLGLQAVIRAEQFGWRTIADRMLTVYQDLTGQLGRDALVGTLP